MGSTGLAEPVDFEERVLEPVNFLGGETRETNLFISNLQAPTDLFTYLSMILMSVASHILSVGSWIKGSKN